MPTRRIRQCLMGSNICPLETVPGRLLFRLPCAQLIKDIKCSKNVNNFTKSLATKVGVAKNVAARPCDFRVEVRGGLIMPGQQLVCRLHVFFDNPDVSQKSLAGEFLFLTDLVDT